MQEIEAPFTHWFSSSTEGGKSLLDDFHAAHGTKESYGASPRRFSIKSDPQKLAQFITQAGFGDQPNAFPSAQIEAEVKSSSSQQPANNQPPGTSSTWDALYAKAVAGSIIAPPYHDVKTTDPTKCNAAANGYAQWLSGAVQTLPTSPTSSSTTGCATWVSRPRRARRAWSSSSRMCQECHNAKLDMTHDAREVPRRPARQMSRDEKDLAIQRLQLDTSTRLRMPPPLFRTISDAERQLMIQTLQQ